MLGGRILDVCGAVNVGERIHGMARKLSNSDIGNMSVAAARKALSLEDIAARTSLPVAIVRRLLDEVSGQTLMHNALVLPNDEGNFDAKWIGKLRAARARDPIYLPAIARCSQIPQGEVKRRLESANGNKRVRNMFAHWPGYEPFYIEGIQERGDLTCSSALSDDYIVVDIANITRLRETDVRRRMSRAHGGALVRNVLSDEWPQAKVSNDEDTDDVGEASLDTNLSVAAGRESTWSFQGSDEHQSIQRRLCELGELRNHYVKTNKEIGSRVRPDVIWYKLNPDAIPQPGASHVFEIERGGSQSITKSLASLKHAHDMWPGTKLYMIVPRANIADVQARLPGSFHEIERALRTAAIEDILKCDLYELAKKLGIAK